MLEKNKMLKKLTIYELKKTWKTVALICGIILGAGLFMGVFHIYSLTDNRDAISETMYDIATLITFLYMMLIPSMVVLATVFLSKRYYKSLYMSEGYFSFTLPASVTEVVSSKMLVGVIWVIATMVSACISLFLTLVIGGGAIKDLATGDLGYLFWVWVVFMGLAIVNIFVCNLSVTVGRLWTKHKLIGTVLCFGCLWTVIGTLAGIFNYIMVMIACYVTTGPIYDWPEEAIYVFLAVDVICAGVLCYILNRVSVAVTDRTLNLE